MAGSLGPASGLRELACVVGDWIEAAMGCPFIRLFFNTFPPPSIWTYSLLFPEVRGVNGNSLVFINNKSGPRGRELHGS